MGMDFGENLAKQRKKAGLSQEELAERLHLTRQTISKWDPGASLPDVEGLRTLCNSLSVSADELLGMESPHEDKYEQKIHRFFTQMMLCVFLIVVFIAGVALYIFNKRFMYSLTVISELMMILPSVFFLLLGTRQLLHRQR